jgi:hypothetical protein
MFPTSSRSFSMVAEDGAGRNLKLSSKVLSSLCGSLPSAFVKTTTAEIRWKFSRVFMAILLSNDLSSVNVAVWEAVSSQPCVTTVLHQYPFL